MVQQNYDISFVIPAFNEEQYLDATLSSIYAAVSDHIPFEIIVVDNGSADRTRNIAKNHGARVLEKPQCAISAVRNLGASVAEGDILVFLDADVLLTASWGVAIPATIEQLRKTPQVITGSMCGLGKHPRWIEKCWWGSRLKRSSVKYINSGHMIMPRPTFETLDGFNENLRTGEDPELCMRARAAGISIVNNPLLKVHHEGYPKTIPAFFKRERWHGAGGVSSLRDLIISKPILFGFVLLIVLCACVTSSILLQQAGWLLLYLGFMTAVSAAAAFHRIKRLSFLLVPCSFLFSIYFTARMVSIFDLVFKHSLVRKR